MKHHDHLELFTNAIWEWFAKHKRTLPWRDLVDPLELRAYKVLVSEIMLQQTQVDPVIEKFNSFIKKFPDIRSLSRASNAEMLLAWKGLGYNRRALNLRDCAIEIDRLGGFPRVQSELLTLPGIGPYCSGAILNFAFDIPTPCIDTNIRRILHRTFFGPEEVDGSWEKSDKELLELSEEILTVALSEGRKTSDWHAALMDFGSEVQTQKKPQWDICPLTKLELMKATKENTPVVFTPKKKKEPGQMIAGKFVPRRLIRGAVIEVLRGQVLGVRLENLGKRVKPDWSRTDETWLKKILKQLEDERMVRSDTELYYLSPDT